MIRWIVRTIPRTETTLISLFLSSFISLSLNAKVIQVQSLDHRFNTCIELIYHHPITLIHYPNFHKRKELQHEINEYCHCQFTKENEIRTDEKLESSLDWFFRDPSQQLNSKDNCSLEKLKHFSNETLYAIFYAAQIAPFIQRSLNERYKQITRMIASEKSVEKKLNCIGRNIFEKCGKIKSLQVTYQCVNQNLKDVDYINEIENKCPEFSPEKIFTSTDGTDFI